MVMTKTKNSQEAVDSSQEMQPSVTQELTTKPENGKVSETQKSNDEVQKKSNNNAQHTNTQASSTPKVTMNVQELKDMSIKDLMKYGQGLNIENVSSLKRQEI